MNLKHWSDQRSNASFCSLLCYRMTKYPFICNLSTIYNIRYIYIFWCLLNVNNICDLLRITWRKTKCVIHDMPTLNLPFTFYWKVALKLPSHLFKKKDGGWEVFPITLLKFPQYWLICIKKVAPITLLTLPQYWTISIGNIVH